MDLPAVGEILEGRYRLDRIIGRGGMGVVVQGHHLQLQRPVAIKLMHRHLAENQDFVERFKREVLIAKQRSAEQMPGPSPDASEESSASVPAEPAPKPIAQPRPAPPAAQPKKSASRPKKTSPPPKKKPSKKSKPPADNPFEDILRRRL